MTTRRAKVINNEDLASHQPRSLRSGKRGHPDDETVPSDDVQPTLSQQDTEANVLTPPPPPQSHQLPLQGGTDSAAQQEQTAEQTVSSQQEADAVEEHSVAEHARGDAVEGTAGQGEPMPTCPNKDSHPQNLKVESSGKNNQGRVEEKSIISPSWLTPTDQPQPQSLPTSQEGGGKDGVCPTVCEEERRGEEENLEHETESNGDSQQEPPSVTCMGDDKSNGVTKEEALGLPAKKRRRRMGMCGLREKGKSHSLETGKRESEKNNTEAEGERGEEEVVNNEEERSVSQTKDDVCQSGDTGTALVAVEGTVPTPSSSSTAPSVPVGGVTEQREVKAKLQTGDCGEKARPEAGEEVQVSMTTSEETDGGDPGCSGGETCQANPGTEPGPVQVKDPDLGTPAGTEGCLGDPSAGGEAQKLEGGEDDTVVEKDGEQKEDGEDGSGETDYRPAAATTPLDAGAESEHQGGDQNSLVQMDSMAGATEGTMERSGAAAEAGTPSAEDTGPGGYNCSGEEFSQAAAAPSGSEENGNCGTDDSSPVTNQQRQAKDTHDSCGSGTLDYVSDSQLNNIVMSEEEVMTEGGGGFSSSDCHEDATELVCGLIRELSSLNRTVMATHRELENVRRGNKGVRAPTRRGFGPGPRHSKI